MPHTVSDDHLRALTADALQLYGDFDEVYKGHLVEAVMRNLPPEFERERVERIVAEMAPGAQ
ncbi:MAG TPA: hypothetical protein VD902_19435 [Symbiobacteriaceae bacterium]|nr:hypothetical protein [Symbiobacteriaceae bacterium]